jgi:hypothetical protein
LTIPQASAVCELTFRPSRNSSRHVWLADCAQESLQVGDGQANYAVRGRVDAQLSGHG